MWGTFPTCQEKQARWKRAPHPFRALLFLLRLLPERPVDFAVERRTTGGELALLIVLGAHQGGAVAEGAADALAVEAAVLLQLPHEIRLRKRGAADADKGNPAVAHV